LEIVGHYPLPGVKEPHGIALDVSSQLAFVAGAGNHILAVVALVSMKTLGTYRLATTQTSSPSIQDSSSFTYRLNRAMYAFTGKTERP
jgi:hypothetical protein